MSDETFKVGDLVEYWTGFSRHRDNIARMTTSTAWLKNGDSVRKKKYGGWPLTHVTQAQVDFERAHTAWLARRPVTKYVTARWDPRMAGSVTVQCSSEEIERAIGEMNTVAMWFSEEPEAPKPCKP